VDTVVGVAWVAGQGSAALVLRVRSPGRMNADVVGSIRSDRLIRRSVRHIQPLRRNPAPQVNVPSMSSQLMLTQFGVGSP
jgi:hypothetical protein